MGLVIGAVVASSATAFASDVKQFILTAASYPIFVNGKEYKDAENPILNFNGSTYIPLAKIGDLTGVKYKWNDTLKRVEIDTKASGEPTSEVSQNPEPTGNTAAVPQGDLKPETEVVVPKGLVQENGETVLYAYDRNGKFGGRFTNEDDTELVIARIEQRDELPPKISDGWLASWLLSKVYNDASGTLEGNDFVYKTPAPIYSAPGASFKQEEYFRFSFPDGWQLKKEFTTSNNVRVINFSTSSGLVGSWVEDRELRSKIDISMTYCETTGSKSIDGVCLYNTSGGGRKFEAKLPNGWTTEPNKAEATLNGMRFKKESGVVYVNVDDLIKNNLYDPSKYNDYKFYFNIADLQKAGILQ